MTVANRVRQFPLVTRHCPLLVLTLYLPMSTGYFKFCHMTVFTSHITVVNCLLDDSHLWHNTVTYHLTIYYVLIIWHLIISTCHAQIFTCQWSHIIWGLTYNGTYLPSVSIHLSMVTYQSLVHLSSDRIHCSSQIFTCQCSHIIWEKSCNDNIHLLYDDNHLSSNIIHL